MNAPIIFMRQRGVVLFISLIALLIMSLAAVALIRSTDTNTVIVGNLALRQTTLTVADEGAEAAIDWLDATAKVNLSLFDSDNLASGYYATYYPKIDANGDGTIDERDDVLYAKSLVDNNGILNTDDDGLGNKIEYVVQRMCRKAEPPDNDADPVSGQQCMLGDPEIGTGSKGVKDITQAGAIVAISLSPIYRVTVKVTGPKNTVSYTQTYVY